MKSRKFWLAVLTMAVMTAVAFKAPKEVLGELFFGFTCIYATYCGVNGFVKYASMRPAPKKGKRDEDGQELG